MQGSFLLCSWHGGAEQADHLFVCFSCHLQFFLLLCCRANSMLFFHASLSILFFFSANQCQVHCCLLLFAHFSPTDCHKCFYHHHPLANDYWSLSPHQLRLIVVFLSFASLHECCSSIFSLADLFPGCPFPWLFFSPADLCKVHCRLFAVGTNVCSCCFVVLGHIEILLFLFLLWVQHHMSCFSIYHAAQVDWCFLFCTLGWQLIAFSISCFFQPSATR